MKTAHAHILSVLAAELRASDAGHGERPIRVLDIGCGWGQLMVDLISAQRALFGRKLELEIFGYEVYDHRACSLGYRENVLGRLLDSDPSVSWEDRLRLGRADESWPFPDGFFDFAISNQVLEHVADLPRFFEEQGRVLRRGGGAAHFYPPRETFVEPHSGVPGVHWLEESSRRKGLWVGSRCGLGKIRSYRREQGRGLEAFCDEFDNYLSRYVFFRSNRAILQMARQGSVRAGFKYTSALLKRALGDDWDSFPYSFDARFRSRSFVAPFVCSTLVQDY